MPKRTGVYAATNQVERAAFNLAARLTGYGIGALIVDLLLDYTRHLAPEDLATVLRIAREQVPEEFAEFEAKLREG